MRSNAGMATRRRPVRTLAWLGLADDPRRRTRLLLSQRDGATRTSPVTPAAYQLNPTALRPQQSHHRPGIRGHSAHLWPTDCPGSIRLLQSTGPICAFPANRLPRQHSFARSPQDRSAPGRAHTYRLASLPKPSAPRRGDGGTPRW